MKVFTLEEARNQLVKIKPIVEDINLKKEELHSLLVRLEEEEDELERMYCQSKIKEIEALRAEETSEGLQNSVSSVTPAGKVSRTTIPYPTTRMRLGDYLRAKRFSRADIKVKLGELSSHICPYVKHNNPFGYVPSRRSKEWLS